MRLQQQPRPLHRSVIKASIVVMTLQGCASDQPKDAQPTQEVVDGGSSFNVNGTTYSVALSNDSLVVSNGTEVVGAFMAPSNGFKVVDFDEDGRKDILLHHISNVGGIHDLIRFIPERQTFELVEHFSSFPEPQKVAGCNCFYSYHRSGCADLDWDSDLFVIQNNQAVRYANVHGHGCEYENPHPMIRVSAIEAGTNELVVPARDSLSIDSAYVFDEAGNKWEFIERYWNSHHRDFIRTPPLNR